MNISDENEKAIQDFRADIDCLKRLDAWADDFNLFDVLKITNAEIRHSNILAWLLDSGENHGIGDAFIKRIITAVVGKCNMAKADSDKLLGQDFRTYRIYRESDHMDIVMHSHTEKTAVVIENKIWSGESAHQLKDYYNKSKADFADCKQILYVFLTPDGHDASDPDNWIPLSYAEVTEALTEATAELTLKPEVRLLIDNYIGAVRKNIMKEKDRELVRICNEIYAEHRTALRLIFENVSIDDSIETEVIRSVLHELDGEGKIIHTDENRWQFFTKEMNEFLPALDEPKSSWDTEYVYRYWFEIADGSLIIHFELGGYGVSDETKAHENALIAAAGKKTDSFKYKRLYIKKAKLSEDDYEGSLKQAVKSLVTSALENEKIMLDKARGELR